MAAEFIETRWRKYGHDRIYLKTSDGIDAGYIDLKLGTISPTSPQFVAPLTACLARWQQKMEAPTQGKDAAEIGAYEALDSVAEVARGGLDVQPFEHDQVGLACEPSPTLSPLPPPPVPYPRLPPPPSDSPTDRQSRNVFAESDAGERDLAQNQPGAMARAEQRKLFTKAPVRNTIARFFDLHTDERAWRVGAIGEERVASRLERLDSSWYALHAVEVGQHGSDIDHVVIGPGGVFTLNTKRHPSGNVWIASNALLINGRRTDYLRNSRFEAQRAQRLLARAVGFDVPVFPVIVLVDIAKTKVKEAPNGVRVMGDRYLVRWLNQQAEKLDADQVSEIYEVARRSTTWTAS